MSQGCLVLQLPLGRPFSPISAGGVNSVKGLINRHSGLGNIQWRNAEYLIYIVVNADAPTNGPEEVCITHLTRSRFGLLGASGVSSVRGGINHHLRIEVANG
jgi:hypothetical protein